MPYVFAGPLDCCSFLVVAETTQNPVLKAKSSSRLLRGAIVLRRSSCAHAYTQANVRQHFDVRSMMFHRIRFPDFILGIR